MLDYYCRVYHDRIVPGSIIVKNLVQERVQELEQLLKDGREKHEKLHRELAQLKDEQTDDQTIEAMVDEANKDVENEIRQEEEYDQWLKEREVKWSEFLNQGWSSWATPLLIDNLRSHSVFSRFHV